MEPKESVSARQAAVFLSSVLGALLSAKIPGALEVVLAKLLSIATDPVSCEPTANTHILAALMEEGRLASAASGIIHRQCKLCAVGETAKAPPAAAASALHLVRRMAERSGQGGPHGFLLRWLFSIPLLSRRIPLDQLTFCVDDVATWVMLMVAVPGVLFLDSEHASDTQWQTFLLGNLTELGFKILLRDVHDATLCDAFFTALNVLWDKLPKDITVAMGMNKRDKAASSEHAGLLAQLRVVYQGHTVEAFFAPLLDPNPKPGRHPWDACRPIAELYFAILATRIPLRTGVLNALTFGAKLIPPLWSLLKGSFAGALRQALSPRPSALGAAVGLFCATLSHLLIISTEDDFYSESGAPLGIQDYALLAQSLKDVLLEHMVASHTSASRDPGASYMLKVWFTSLCDLNFASTYLYFTSIYLYLPLCYLYFRSVRLWCRNYTTSTSDDPTASPRRGLPLKPF